MLQNKKITSLSQKFRIRILGKNPTRVLQRIFQDRTRVGFWKSKIRNASFVILSLLLPFSVSATQWVTDITECGTAYMSIDCEADQYVCGFDGIMHCSTPKEADQAKAKAETSFDIQSGLPAGLVLDCHAEASSCLPWQCQADTTCETANQSTECPKAGGFTCGDCKDGYLDCDKEAGCETADGAPVGKNARYDGCKGLTCDAGYLDCDKNTDNGCEIKSGGACTKDGQVGTYSESCNGNQPPPCNVFTQQFASVQTETGETITSKLQVDDSGNVNIPEGAQFMVAGIPVNETQDSECQENQLKLGTRCIEIPVCEFLTFNGNTFACADKPVIDTALIKDCQEGSVKIGTACQAIPTCDLLRFDGKNGKFLCAKTSSATSVSSENQTSTMNDTQLEALVNTKFVQLASKLEQDFSQMLTGIHQQISAGLESGKIVAVSPDAIIVPSDTDGSESSFFSTIAEFFSQLFQ